jgi:chorismate-pyruvate lyase
MDRFQRESHARGCRSPPISLPLAVTAPDSSNLQQLLLDNPGTVTHFLENLTGEVIFADVVRQYSMRASTGNGLGVTVGHPTTHRMAVLKGSTTDLPYLYAESTFLPERLPERARAQLDRSNEPIGRILVDCGLKTRREELPQPGPVGAHVQSSIDGFSYEIVWSRAYRLSIDELAIFAIREWFFRSVLQALDRQARS